ncbi:MAG: type II secretion system F family protein [Deltaproteobacteria bacterium]|nr:type II secretion system F family protein [Deltaproteobacteria bacterium]
MQGLDWLVWAACFVTGTFFVYGVLQYTGSRRMVKDRFKNTTAKAMPLYQRESSGNWMKRILDGVSSCGKFITKGKEETYKLRFSLIQAGFRHPKGTAIYFGFQALGAFFLPIPYLLFNAMHGKMTSGNLLFCVLLAGAGFYLPKVILNYIIRRRKDRIDKGLPDVLDLLIVCMEAGLSLQATINRVADEVRPISLDLHNELTLLNAELRTGISRETALKNMGERTGVQNVNSLVGVMVQSDKMGTSISQALRVHSAFLRTQRAQQAEEQAAKLPVKIMFPMLMFIFPAVFVVVLGPAIIHIMQSGFFKSTGS